MMLHVDVTMNHDDFDVHDHNDGVDVSVNDGAKIKKHLRIMHICMMIVLN